MFETLDSWLCGVLLLSIYKYKYSMLFYLTDLFTWRLVLCALAQVFNTLVFGQVVFLLGHIFPIIQHFMQQFSVTREEEKKPHVI